MSEKKDLYTQEFKSLQYLKKGVENKIKNHLQVHIKTLKEDDLNFYFSLTKHPQSIHLQTNKITTNVLTNFKTFNNTTFSVQNNQYINPVPVVEKSKINIEDNIVQIINTNNPEKMHYLNKNLENNESVVKYLAEEVILKWKDCILYQSKMSENIDFCFVYLSSWANEFTNWIYLF